jgi:hypothetical protein
MAARRTGVKVDFPRIEHTLRSSRSHLDTTGMRGTEIELYLANYALGVIYAEYEQAVRELIIRRSQVGVDTHHDAFVAVAATRITRSFRFSDLAGYLNYFDNACKQHFMDCLENTQHHLAWDSLMKSRQDFAHAAGSQVTFDELDGYYRASARVLEVFGEAVMLGQSS